MVKISSHVIRSKLPCDQCGSSDAVSWYSDDHGYCFSCNYFHKSERLLLTSEEERGTIEYLSIPKVPTLSTLKYEVSKKDNLSTLKYEVSKKERSIPKEILKMEDMFYMSFRGVHQDTMKKYGVKTKVVDNKPKTIYYPYGSNGWKTRSVEGKEFLSVGDMQDKSLFGLGLFTPGMASKVVITEGELDAMSAYQMLDGKYPCLSIKSASSAKKDVSQAREFLNSFNEIVLCLDSDEPGLKAAKTISEMFDVNKIKFVQFAEGMKDPNDYLKVGKVKEFVSAFNNADKYRPKGIVSSYSQVETALSKNKNASQVATYPFNSLNELTYGIRLGELLLFTAQEKIGKTEIIRAIEYHLLKTTDHKIGIIHLEEEERRTLCGLVGYHVKKPVHLPDSGFSNEDILKSYKELTKEEDRVHVYGHFGSDDPDIILDIIRHLVVVSGCKFVFLDHITMLVTGFEDEDERKKLDYISTKLAMMTRELNFTLFLISHVNDDGKTRGSRNIAKVADLIVALDRDIEHTDPEIRNTTHITVKGNRFSGRSGPACPLFFSTESYTLSEKVFEETQMESIKQRNF